MDKKWYLLMILDKLESKRNLAKWLKFLIEQWNLDDSVLDIITQSIEWAIDTTQDDHDFIELKMTLRNS